MQLNQQQTEQFDELGYIYLPDVFSTSEVELLRDEATKIFALDREEVVRENDGRTARTAFAAQHYNEAYRRLGRHPRLLGPVMQLLDGDVYMHQYKINAKAGVNGDVWKRPQGYGTRARDNCKTG